MTSPRQTTTEFSDRTLGEMRQVRDNIKKRLDLFDVAIQTMEQAFGPADPTTNGVVPLKTRYARARPKYKRSKMHVRRGDLTKTIRAALAPKHWLLVTQLGEHVAGATGAAYYRRAKGRASISASLTGLMAAGEVERKIDDEGNKLYRTTK